MFVIIIFFEDMCKGIIKIFPIDNKDQIADTLTKAMAQNDGTCAAPYPSKPPKRESVA